MLIGKAADYAECSVTSESSALHLLHRAGQCAGDIFNQRMKTIGLTPRQYMILKTVALHEGLNQTDLVERTGVDRSTLADIIRRMLTKGLLKRRRMTHDARAFRVAEIHIVRDRKRFGTGCNQIAIGFGNGLFTAFDRIGHDIARGAVGGGCNALVRA